MKTQMKVQVKLKKALILKALQQGDRLTHLDAEKRFNCLRLGARIYDLKQQGHKIERRMIIVPSGKCVAEYRLVA
jgi:hypothetical protein